MKLSLATLTQLSLAQLTGPQLADTQLTGARLAATMRTGNKLSGRSSAKGQASYPGPVQLALELPAQDLRAVAEARMTTLWLRAVAQLSARAAGRKSKVKLRQLPHLAFYRGRSDAGRALLLEERIEINEDLLERYPDAMLEETIAHELAHLLVYRLFGRRASAHGQEWQAIMRQWFQVEPQRTHNFDLNGLGVRRQQRFAYYCGCRPHELSAVRHRRALRGVDYRCVACQGRLQRGLGP